MGRIPHGVFYGLAGEGYPYAFFLGQLVDLVGSAYVLDGETGGLEESDLVGAGLAILLASDDLPESLSRISLIIN
jgi:hypothetical protein